MNAARRLFLWCILCGALVIAGATWIIALRGDRITRSDGLLVGGWLFLTALLVAIAALLKTTPGDAIRLPRSASIVIILLVMMLLQGLGVYYLQPRLSTDVDRFGVEGRMWRDAVSPYATPPNDYAASPISHGGLPSIYPPIAQLFFVAGTAVSLRIILSMLALLSAVLLMAILSELRASVWWAILFAWNPLVVLECGAMVHVDVVGVALLLLALWCVLRRHSMSAATMLALSCGIKPQALILLPWLLRDLPRPRGAAVGVFASVLAIAFVPALLYQHGYRGLLFSAHQYFTRWEFNGSIFELIKALFGQGDEGRNMERAKLVARTLAPIATLTTAITLWRRGASLIEAGYWLQLVPLLFSPVIYPWYLLWMLAFVPLLRGRAGWTGLSWSGTVGISYIVWHQPSWKLPAWAAGAEYLPVYLVLALELFFLTRVAGQTASAAPRSPAAGV